MGLFDYVIYEAPCAKCGAPLRDWQTKSTPDPYMERLTPDKIVGGVFYTECRACKTWNEFAVVPTGYLIRRVEAPDNDA